MDVAIAGAPEPTKISFVTKVEGALPFGAEMTGALPFSPVTAGRFDGVTATELWVGVADALMAGFSFGVADWTLGEPPSVVQPERVKTATVMVAVKRTFDENFTSMTPLGESEMDLTV